MTHLSRHDLEDHASGWIAAWNRHDVEAVLEPFADDAVFVSPLAASVTGRATIEGRAALGAYWTAALGRVPDLRFRLVAALCDPQGQSLLVHYLSHAGGRTVRAAELMRFREGRQVYGEAFYGAVVDPVHP